MTRITTAILVGILACVFAATAVATPKPGTTGSNGGTYGPVAVKKHRPARAKKSSSPTASTSGLGREHARYLASSGLNKEYGGHWKFATYRQLKFKRRGPGGRVRFEFFWATQCCTEWGWVTVWRDPCHGCSGYDYWYSITPGRY